MRWCLVASFVLASVGAAVVTAQQASEEAAPATTPTTAVTFHKDVEPLLQKHCQTCHRPGEIGPMSLLSYQEARPWARSIKARVMARLMPPWFADPQFGHFRNDRNLAQSEIDTFAAWVDAGAPEGSPQDAPRPLMFPDGWEIKPDLVVEAPPFDVPAVGVVEWTSVIFPSGFTKDTWVDSIQIRPSERQVAHHICFGVRNHRDGVEYYKPEAPEVPRDVDGVAFPRHVGDRARPNAQATANRQGATNGPSWDGCYLPGVPALDLTHSNSAKLIPAHADFVIEFHYTTTGKAVTDHVKIGFTVAKEEPSRRFITYATGPTAGTDAEHFRIPANEPNYESTFEGTIMEDAELVWMLPHMHLRGKNMKWMLVYPDGRQDVVLYNPRFEYAWQIGYEPVQPIKVPKGTKLVVVGHHDNSAGNKFNPNPNKDVYYGNQAWEEMMSPWFGLVVPKDVDPKTVLKTAAQAASGG